MNITQLTQKEADELMWEIEMENRRREAFPRFSEKDLLTMFPEAKDIISEKIKEWQQVKSEIIDTIKKKLTLIKYKISDELSKFFWREWIKCTDGQELLIIDGHITRLKWLLTVASGVESKGGINQEKIRQVLTISIFNIVSQYVQLRKCGKNYVGKCPLHDDKSPSFYVYPETNSYYCFGCHRGGDVINFVMSKLCLDFKQAVKYLIGGTI